jgi:hypothetical protein
MAALFVVLGLILLAFGHRLFWLLVGALGFAAGWTIGISYFHDRPESFAITLAVGLGIVGVVVAILLQKVAIRVAGFLAGGTLAVIVAENAGWVSASFPWVPFLIGGVIGILLVAVIFRLTLIVLSSVAGAFLVVYPLHLGNAVSTALFVILGIAGIVIQSRRPHRGAAEKQGGGEA